MDAFALVYLLFTMSTKKYEFVSSYRGDSKESSSVFCFYYRNFVSKCVIYLFII